MKMAAFCLLPLVGGVAALIAFHEWFLSAGKEHPQIWVATNAASFCTILTLGLLYSVVVTWGERVKLRNSGRGRFPEDGKRIVVAGRIRSAAPLVSPISATSVVAYKYEMQRQARHGPLRDYVGMALAASTLDTPAGPLRLLSLPDFDVPKLTGGPETLRNAEAYVAATEFTRIQDPQEEGRTRAKRWADDDGVYRLDQRGTDNPNLPGCVLNEWIIPQDATVCVFGRYDHARAGILPDRKAPNTMRIMLGDAGAVASTLASRIAQYTFSAVITAGIVVTICALYFANAR